MITKFDLDDKSTWPEEDTNVLWLCKDRSENSLIFVDSLEWMDMIDPDFNFFSIDPKCENAFSRKDIIAWQPLPTWGNLDE